MPKTEPPMHVGARNGAEHIGGADLARRRLVQARRIAHRPLDQLVEDRKRDIDQQQARDRLVDAAIVLQAPGQRDPQPASRHAGHDHGELHDDRRRIRQRQRRRGGGERAHEQRALAADDHESELRGQRGAQRREDQRRRAAQRVLPREPGAERALVHIEVEIDRVLAEQRDENAERHERATSASAGMTTYSAAPPNLTVESVGSNPELRSTGAGAPTSAFTKSLRSLPRPDSSSSQVRDRSGRA